MTTRRTLFAWLQSAFLRLVTPKPKTFQLNEDTVIYVNGVPHTRADYKPTEGSTIVFQPEPPKPSKPVEYLLGTLKAKFNKATDMLVISEGHLEEALNFDVDGWLNSVAQNLIVFSDDLVNIAVVRAGYGGKLF